MATSSEFPTPISRIETRGLRVASLIGRRILAAVKWLQYARMVSVLNKLPDRHLEKIGLRRCEIPEQARRLIYGA